MLEVERGGTDRRRASPRIAPVVIPRDLISSRHVDSPQYGRGIDALELRQMQARTLQGRMLVKGPTHLQLAAACRCRQGYPRATGGELQRRHSCVIYGKTQNTRPAWK